MSEGKAASGPFHSDASRNLSGRRGRPSSQQSPLALSPAPHTTPAERVSPRGFMRRAGLCGVGDESNASPPCLGRNHSAYFLGRPACCSIAKSLSGVLKWPGLSIGGAMAARASSFVVGSARR
jgi:hypothetical protein